MLRCGWMWLSCQGLCGWFGEELHHLHLNQKTSQPTSPWWQQHSCICTIHAQLHIYKHSFDKFMTCKKKKKSQTYIVTRSQKWGNELQIRQISLNCAINFLSLFALLSWYLCRSKWAVKWWMIMLWWKCAGTTIAQTQRTLHTLRASSKHSR